MPDTVRATFATGAPTARTDVIIATNQPGSDPSSLLGVTAHNVDPDAVRAYINQIRATGDDLVINTPTGDRVIPAAQVVSYRFTTCECHGTSSGAAPAATLDDLPPLTVGFGPGPAPSPTPGGTPGSPTDQTPTDPEQGPSWPQPRRGAGGGAQPGAGNTGGTGDGREGDASSPRRPGGRSTGPRGTSKPGRAPRASRAARVRTAVRQLFIGTSTPRVSTGPRAITAGRPGRGGRRTGSSLLPGLRALAAWLGGLLRGGHARVSGFSPETWRVIGILIAATLVTLAANVDLGPAPVEAPNALPAATATAGTPSAAPAGGGMVNDPTSKGRITATTAHGLAEIRANFPAVRSASCWDKHAWNPRSDHPLGKACDVYVSPAGKFAAQVDPAGLEQGNRLVAWLRQYADVLGVNYVIWQGRIWSRAKGDHKYQSGVYDVTDPTGGHFDHLHVSFVH